MEGHRVSRGPPLATFSSSQTYLGNLQSNTIRDRKRGQLLHKDPPICVIYLASLKSNLVCGVRGILSLQAPPAPPAFHRLASDLSRLYSHTTAPVRGQSARVWGEQRQPCCGAASCGDDDEKDHHYLSDAVETAEAVLCRHFGPPLPYNGYTTPSGKQCRLAPGDTVRHFLHPSVESFVMSLFRCIEDQRTPLVTLGPHCLFHAHLFRALPPAPGVGLLFHACEYPAYHEVHFPYRLGHCQEGSHLRPAGQQLAHRNLLWYQDPHQNVKLEIVAATHLSPQDKLVVLDVSSGSLLRHALWEETSELCTLYEEDFGIPMLDLTLDVVERSAWRYAKLLASLR
ncbi:hypothetical protein VOLCADRAFT_103545 [Volvox carteri f. nagariensis]|uniref:Uncharacterized protein n=1 Tax=Volvox carteri f. nagariensis TaxID=3068 RepID=D8TML9_VOLCA|nr:uncharacterized protein VOLCADRAFT_103545 [Volvox carteri f. nagariensis]EFJ51146.1 hypothetical protein VOLCADRAFT_103545 [Volvox carteri f. nagariensis]|eukprot:XP_002947613.1 hypothetical protein VOLCADRAFT_103545 [Volvox carteri f. nagariensis]